MRLINTLLVQPWGKFGFNFQKHLLQKQWPDSERPTVDEDITH